MTIWSLVRCSSVGLTFSASTKPEIAILTRRIAFCTQAGMPKTRIPCQQFWVLPHGSDPTKRVVRCQVGRGSGKNCKQAPPVLASFLQCVAARVRCIRPYCVAPLCARAGAFDLLFCTPKLGCTQHTVGADKMHYGPRSFFAFCCCARVHLSLSLVCFLVWSCAVLV